MTKYPAIEKACTLLTYHNGGINRDRSIESMVLDLDNFLIEVASNYDLVAIDEWLSEQSDTDLETILDGERSEMEFIMINSPSGTDEFLDELFFNVV
jgi:hypothetical protein